MFVCIGVTLYLLTFIVVMILTLCKYSDHLDNKKIKDTFGNLYVGINYRRKGIQTYYWPFFFIRRIIFVSIPIAFNAQHSVQLQILCFLTSLYIIIIVHLRPHMLQK